MFDRRWLLILFLTVLCCRAYAGDAVPLTVSDAWVRAVPPSVGDSAAFMVLANTGDVPLRLTGARTALAGMAMPMETTHKTVQGVDVVGMKGVDFIEVPAHGEVRLKPGGDHLMLMGLTSHPRPGEVVTITLQFQPGNQTVTVSMPARIDG